MALSHIVMHLALCNAAARLGPQTQLPVRVVVTDKINRDVVDEKTTIPRDENDDGVAEFDIPWGIYRATVTMRAGRATCSSHQYVAVMADHNRSITVHLQDTPTPVPAPVILEGTAPVEYAYTQPTIVFFGKDTKCNGAVGNTLNVTEDQETDEDAYYSTVYPTLSLLQQVPTLAVRLTDTRGGYHYVHLPSNFLTFSGRWADLGEFDITDDLIQYLADKPEDTLLCIHGYETTTTFH
ncbi:MAG TPA: hypothetical protein VKT72_17245 [Candidatus Baltobacteraceae bacterium]|nr:hypothetical protein [Candidatus Baltobacteraceae bacterium]